MADPTSAIVLDVDETLVHTYTEPADVAHCRAIIDGKGTGQPSYLQDEQSDLDELTQLDVLPRLYPLSLNDGQDYYVLERPYMTSFLDWCFANFGHVIIWSAGRRDYVHAVCRQIFPDPEQQPHAILDWDHCQKEGDEYCKPLDNLHSDRRLNLDARKVLIVDDRKKNDKYNPERFIKIPAWEPAARNIGQWDYALPKLEAFLEAHALSGGDYTHLPACDWRRPHYLERI